jgi:hypothetical protein
MQKRDVAGQRLFSNEAVKNPYSRISTRALMPARSPVMLSSAMRTR